MSGYNRNSNTYSQNVARGRLIAQSSGREYGVCKWSSRDPNMTSTPTERRAVRSCRHSILESTAIPPNINKKK